MVLGGCGDGADQGGGQSPTAEAPVGNPPGGPPSAKSSPKVKEIMVRLTKGPNSLTPVIGKELNEAQPPWETLQPQTREYAQLASEMGQYDPPRGSKESWVKQTLAYAEMATEMDRATQAKDKDAALAAHTQITNSCILLPPRAPDDGAGEGRPPRRPSRLRSSSGRPRRSGRTAAGWSGRPAAGCSGRTGRTASGGTGWTPTGRTGWTAPGRIGRRFLTGRQGSCP